MIPILFDKTATDFTTNGIGRLECLSCVVTEERNGIYELEAECPISGSHVSDLEIDSIIGVIPYDGGSMQGFRVYEITKPLNGRFTVYARHISYQLLNIPTAPFTVAASASACATTLATLKTNAYENCPFTFWTNVTTAGSYSQTVPAVIRQRLLGTEGSVLDQFGGEYEWDNYTVKLHNKRGTVAENNGIVLRYGKNITDIEQEENISNVITGVVPYWADSAGNLVTLPNKEVVYSQYASRYPFKRTVPLDLSDKWEDAPSTSALRTAAQAFVNNSELGVPKVSIEVSFVALWQSEEYKDVLPLQRVKLCDEITVIFEKYGIERIAKIVRTEYNVLKDRYDKIQVGDLRSSFTTAVNDMNAQTIQQIESQSVSTKEAINNATKWLTSAGGYVIAIKNTDGSWKELAFSDKTNPYAPNANVLLINNNGLGFSKTGLNGSFTNAWTIDGNLVADFIHGGTLTLGGNNNGNGIMSFVDSNDHEIIRIDRTGIYLYSWEYKNSTWYKYTIGSWTPSGIDIKKGSISGTDFTFGQNNLHTVLKYGPTAQFNNENALLIQGNDRISIESSDYQVRVTGSSTHMGVKSGNSYINTTEDYVGVIAKTGARVAAGDSVYITSSPTGGISKGLRIDQGGIDTVNCDINGYAQAPENDTIYFYTFDSNGHNYLGIMLNGSAFGSVQVS